MAVVFCHNNHQFSSVFVYLLLLNQCVIFVLSDKQPLSATNFLYELDKITQEILTVSCFQNACILTDMYTVHVPLPNFETRSLFTSCEVFPEKLAGGVRPAFQNPYPIYDQNLRYSLPYL